MTSDTPPDEVADDELLRRAASGDAAAFTVLFRRRQPQVYRFALHMTGVPAIAEDVTQEVFLAVIRNADRYEAGRSSVVAWLCGIARNHAWRRLARDRRLVPMADSGADGHDAGPADEALQPLEVITRAEQAEAVRSALLTLPVHYREAIALCDLQELNYIEAAAALGCAVGTVRSRLHRGRALLAAKLHPDVPACKPTARCLA